MQLEVYNTVYEIPSRFDCTVIIMQEEDVATVIYFFDAQVIDPLISLKTYVVRIFLLLGLFAQSTFVNPMISVFSFFR